MLKVFIIVILGLASGETIDEKLDYYKNIWNSNVEAVKTWVRPTSNSQFDYDPKIEDPHLETYDFIIVGGGSSGAVLANRLSKQKSRKVLLLEAGGDETDFSLIPGAYLTIQSSPLNWGYLTKPQTKACQAMVNNQCNFARGKALGGETALNENVFVRGNKKDYDAWEALGNSGWNYKTVLKYFKKMETISGFDGDARYRGRSGPWSVSAEAESIHSLSNVILGGHIELGYEDLDYNGANQIGSAKIQSSVLHGSRHSTNQAYLKPICDRRNLVIRTKALATKINFREKENSLVATSVEYLHDGKLKKALARKEVIVSAGTINSPQLLILSGIGPIEELDKHGIPNLINLPVGKNLKDHVTYFSLTIDTNASLPVMTLEDDLKDYLNGFGRMAAPLGAELSFRTKSGNKDDVPDISITHSLPRNFNGMEVVKRQTNYRDDIFFGSTPIKPNAILTHITLLNPKSTGLVTLKSSNPLDYPIIDPKYLDHDDDVETLYWGIQEVLKLVDTDSFKSINARLADNSIPPCRGPQTEKSYWICRIRHTASGIYHPIGTCRMGNSRTDSVVSNKLIVHGTKNLRVVDASVIPICSGYTNPIAVMMAEKISDEINDKYDD